MMIFIVTSIGIIVNGGRSRRRRSSGTVIMLIAAMIRVSNFLVLLSVYYYTISCSYRSSSSFSYPSSFYFLCRHHNLYSCYMPNRQAALRCPCLGCWLRGASFRTETRGKTNLMYYRQGSWESGAHDMADGL